MIDAAYTRALLEIGRSRGLDAVGATRVDPFDAVAADLAARRTRGLAADMEFTYRNPARSADPARALPEAAALVVGARSYAASDPPAPGGRAVGRVARFARGGCYDALRSALGAIAERLTTDGWRARLLVDDNALVDRAAAYRAGLGWWGRNSCLLGPKGGSWFVLGSVVTDAPLATRIDEVEDGCGRCRRCIDACPTGAIVAPGVVDARRCLTWLLQAGGTFPVEHREALGDRLYGCDTCQEVCPPSRVPSAEASDPDDTWVDIVELLSGTDEQLLARCGDWYIADRDPRVVRRNALVVLGNTGDPDDPEVAAVLLRHIEGDDDLLAEHAGWAAARLGLVTTPL